MRKAIVLLVAVGSCLLGAPGGCDVGGYHDQPGLTATVEGRKVTAAWTGEQNTQLRLTVDGAGQEPVIRELAVKGSGGWKNLGRDLTPDFFVTVGKRRISNQQISPLKELGIDLTPDVIEREKWKAFWDAPLEVPGSEGTNPGLPRSAGEIVRAGVQYHISGCSVKTDGGWLEIAFDGLDLGPFRGGLQFTVYKGSNLVRQEAIASTELPSAAYHYRAGLKGFRLNEAQRVVWRDTARAWQKYEFGGAVNQDPVALRARNRMVVVETPDASLAVFPPPHKFFFAREIELNLGFVYYRKDDGGSFSVGVRQADKEEMFRPYGYSDELWKKRVNQARHMAQGNFALYNAPPGTKQRMAVYYYLSPGNGRAAQQSVLRYTHDDAYKPLPGYQVAISHFHTAFTEQLRDAGTMDYQPAWIPVFRALGVNIAMMSDFHGDGHERDAGDLRLGDIDDYNAACRRHSDKDFLLIPGEEPNAWLGGHYTMIFPRPVYWTRVRKPDQPFSEKHPQYGTVYHTGSSADVLALLEKEQGLVWQSHPRTKGSTYYPDAIRDKDYFQSDRFLGGAFQSLPVDLSEKRLCEERCLGVLDDMNNWAGPKYLFSEGDTYHKYPEQETYPQLLVNYVKLAALPSFDQGWASVTEAIRRGDYFSTSGEVLIPESRVDGSGAKRTYVAQVDWTFPLEFVELVWGDGKTTGRIEKRATGAGAFGNRRFEIPFDAAGKKWVRFAAWDAAGNGAISQPVHLTRDR